VGYFYIPYGGKMSKLYTKKDIAKELGLSEETVRKYCQNGKINAQKIGSIGCDRNGMFVISEKEMKRLRGLYGK